MGSWEVLEAFGFRVHFTFSLNSSMWSGVGSGNGLPSSTGFRCRGEQVFFGGVGKRGRGGEREREEGREKGEQGKGEGGRVD